MDTPVDIIGVSDDESDTDSDNDENICRTPTKSSPQKSPLKLSAVLKRKRRLSLSEPGSSQDCHKSSDMQPGHLVSYSDDSEGEEDIEEDGEKEDEDEECMIEQSRAATASSKKADFVFKEPSFRKKQFIFHPFKSVNGVLSPVSTDNTGDQVTVTIPEQLAASYGLYIWPCAPVLAWYFWLNQNEFRSKRILELGAGTSLPGILLAKIGSEVTLSDSVLTPKCLDNCREAVKMNNLQENVQVIPLTWGLVTMSLLNLKNKLDWVVGSDLFFDPSVFEKLIFTIQWLLSNNPGAGFVCTVQERSADWSIDLLLKKYSLRCEFEYPERFLAGTGISPSDLTGSHTIFVLKIFLKE